MSKHPVIDDKDRVILLELDTDATQSLGDMADKLRITKEAVSYRIKQLESAGVIRGYTAIYNSTMLGLLYFKFYIKLSNLSDEKKSQIMSFASENSDFNWIATSEGPFDMMIGVHFPSIYEFEQYRNKFLSKFGGFVQKCTHVILTEGEAYPRQYLVGKANPGRKVFVFCSRRPGKAVNAADAALVREIALNARAPLTNISAKTGLTPNIVRYKRNAFEKTGVISGYKIFVDYRKLGAILFKCSLKVNNIGSKRFSDLKLYARQQPNIIYWMRVLGEWDVELDVEVPSIEDLYRITDEIRSKFSDIVQSLDVLFVSKDSMIYN